ncbi:MAG: FAD-dependent oxidoreductase [Gammaproteobacteria bacterium]|nr:FAD-dependent oxidoreductase [Gammaproteobacteria bacterium]
MTNAGDSAIDVNVDVLIIGGGIAGLWTLARLQQAGYKAVLLESQALGAGQTRFAQGIIHGGTKYALTGKLTASSAAVADMPSRWRACYEGTGELDLSKAELLSDAHYLWSTSSLTSRISGFFASKVMRTRTTELEKNSLPAMFQHEGFKGQFYRLDEPVFDTLSVIRALAEPRKRSILTIRQQSLKALENGLLVESQAGKHYFFDYKKIILLAGQGNENLLSRLDCNQPEMQLRPLKMVVMRNKNLNDMIYVHCLAASVNPRITITSHRDNKGNIVWYMGGQLAEDGVGKSDDALIESAKNELSDLIPWLDLKDSEWGVLDIDRAEIKLASKTGAGAVRPDSFSVEQHENIITAWPTKMALSPVLADTLLAMLEQDDIEKSKDSSLPEWQAADYADFPWNEKSCWQRGKAKC